MIGKLKHTATVIYRALGFVYALAGLVGCVLLLVFKNDLSADPEKRDVILKLACLGLFFFIVLILGLLLRNEKLTKAHLMFIDGMCLLFMVVIIWAGHSSSEKIRIKIEETKFLSLPEKIAQQNEAIQNIETRIFKSLIYIVASYAVGRFLLVGVIKSIKNADQQQVNAVAYYV
uniref:(northern house mosquito) hypothetical protein n=1 Tax=Culex pipiens TaxID=7175 RepID=A0A8D8DPQ2_CULPI